MIPLLILYFFAFFIFFNVAISVEAATPVPCRATGDGVYSQPLKFLFVNPLTGLPQSATDSVRAMLAGTEAAFHAVNYSDGPSPLLGECGNATAGSGYARRHLEVVVMDSAGNATRHVEVLQQAMAAHPDTIAVLPTIVDQIIEATVPVLAAQNLIMLGPQSRGDALRTFHPNLLFLAPPSPLVMLALLKYLIFTKQFRRIGFMVSVHLGRESLERTAHYQMYKRLEAAAIDLGAVPAGLFIADAQIDYGLPSTISPTAQMTAFLAGRPQCVLMFAYPLASTAQFLATVAGLMGPSFVFAASENVAAPMAQTLLSIGIGQMRGRLVIGLPLPLAADTRYAAMRRMRDEAAAVPGSNLDLGATGMFFVVGWLHAKFAIAVLENIAARLRNKGQANATITRAMFGAALLGGPPRMVNVHDLTYGAFAGPCAGPERVLCACNEGGHEADVGLFADNASIVSFPAGQGARITVPLGVCANTAVRLPAPVFAATARAPLLFCVRRGDVFSDGTQLCGPAPAQSLLAGVGALPSLAIAMLGGDMTVRGRPMLAYDASARHEAFTRATTPMAQWAALAGLRDQAPMTVAALGIAVPGTAYAPLVALPPMGASRAQRTAFIEAACGGTMVLEPVAALPLAGAPHAFDPCTVRFTATPEQELHATAAYVKGRGAALRYVAAFDATGLAATAAAVQLSADFAGHAAAARGVAVLPAIVNTATPLATALAALTSSSRRTVFFVVGMASAADAAALVALLAAHTEAEVVLPHAHAVLWHGALAASLWNYDVSIGQRLLVATSLGPWNLGGGSLQSQSFATPAAQLWANAAAFLASLADPDATTPIAGGPLLARLYEVGAVGSLAAGPYSLTPCPAGVDVQAAASDLVCELSSGARNVQLVRFAAADGNSTLPDAAVAHTETFSTARGGFPAAPAASDQAEWFWAVVGSSLGVAVVLLVVAASLTLYYWRVVRPQRYAPKDPSQPFTIVFTDVQSSTALWAEIPEVMAAAMPAHHRLLRAALTDHRGYEVRTIGDAFMVAFKHAGDAAAFAASAQVALRRHDWADDGAIDAQYARLAMELEEKAQRAAQRRRSSAARVQMAFPPSRDTDPPDPPVTARAPNPRRRTLSFDPAAGVSEDGDAEASPVEIREAPPPEPGTGRRVTIIESPHQGRRTRLREQERAALREWEDGGQSAMCPWRGLRVRIGLHTGTGTIAINDTSGRFDYGGAVVAAAAAVQDAAHGGQVLLSAQAHAALSKVDLRAVARHVTRGRERLERDHARTERRRRRHVSGLLDAFARSKKKRTPKVTADELVTAVSGCVPVPGASFETASIAVLQLEIIAGRVFPPLRCLPAATPQRPRRGSPTIASLVPDLVVTPGPSTCASPVTGPEALPPLDMESLSSLPGAHFSASSALVFRASHSSHPREQHDDRDPSAPQLLQTTPPARGTGQLHVPVRALSALMGASSSGSLDVSMKSAGPAGPQQQHLLALRSVSSGSGNEAYGPCTGGDATLSSAVISLYLQTVLHTFSPADRRALIADLLVLWGCNSSNSSGILPYAAGGSPESAFLDPASARNGHATIGDCHGLLHVTRSTTLTTSDDALASQPAEGFAESLQQLSTRSSIFHVGNASHSSIGGRAAAGDHPNSPAEDGAVTSGTPEGSAPARAAVVEGPPPPPQSTIANSNAEGAWTRTVALARDVPAVGGHREPGPGSPVGGYQSLPPLLAVARRLEPIIARRWRHLVQNGSASTIESF